MGRNGKISDLHGRPGGNWARVDQPRERPRIVRPRGVQYQDVSNVLVLWVRPPSLIRRDAVKANQESCLTRMARRYLSGGNTGAKPCRVRVGNLRFAAKTGFKLPF